MVIALPDVYDYCEKKHINHFIRLPMNDSLRNIMESEIARRLLDRPHNMG
jgi:hypothetical protein